MIVPFEWSDYYKKKNKKIIPAETCCKGTPRQALTHCECGYNIAHSDARCEGKQIFTKFGALCKDS